ncbi:hypothetical protein FISHEDRAFT_61904 [Fistulina hepatica ATCC 64428]|uniref:Uncharacterized protein n=1 Tax=Fistulina hepatica ATCC 64428 TaxID=1128425 RepID=A0A0D7A0P8_9AGAR|nr:hypothetical protein FISHEDRAFT_61904 [Fistulina hepatica ATCC 64428]
MPHRERPFPDDHPYNVLVTGFGVTFLVLFLYLAILSARVPTSRGYKPTSAPALPPAGGRRSCVVALGCAVVAPTFSGNGSLNSCSYSSSRSREDRSRATTTGPGEAIPGTGTLGARTRALTGASGTTTLALLPAGKAMRLLELGTVDVPPSLVSGVPLLTQDAGADAVPPAARYPHTTARGTASYAPRPPRLTLALLPAAAATR